MTKRPALAVRDPCGTLLLLRALPLLVVALSVVAVPLGGVRADPLSPDPPSVFHLRKSQNRNEVHYALHLAADCAPDGAAPVVPYWRMLEEGPDAVEPLLGREHRAYGLASQIVARADDGWIVTMRLRALSGRAIRVEVTRGNRGCQTRTSLFIAGGWATFEDAFVQLGLVGVDYVRLTGVRGGRHVVEDVEP